MTTTPHRRLLYIVSLLICRAHAFSTTPWTRIAGAPSAFSPVDSTSIKRRRPHTSFLSMVSTQSSSSSTRQLSSPTRLEKMIVQLGRRGKTDQALEIYHSIKKPTIRQVNSAMDACARARPTRLDECFDLLKEGILTHKLKPNEYSFGAVMSACSRARRADRAIHVLHDMKNTYQVEPNAVIYSSAISACARSDPPDYETALELLEQALPEQINVVGYNAALSACARAGAWQSAIQLLEKMKAPQSVVVPDQVTYGTILAACEASGEWKLLLKYAHEMHLTKLELDGMSFTSVLHACQQLGLAEQALFYLEKMKHLSQHETRMTQGRVRMGARPVLQGPDAVAYRLCISACARGGKWQNGILLLREMEDPDVVAYTAAITGCEYAGEWKRAFGLLEEMRMANIEPNQVTMAAVIGACAVASMNLVKHGNHEEAALPKQKALQLLKVMKRDDSVVDPNIVVYNAAIRACGEALDLPSALKLLDEIYDSKLEPTVVTYGSLMTACERDGNLEAASRVFKQMRSVGMEPNEIVYGAAISTCRKAGDAERALLLLRKMIRQELSPNVATFNTVLVAQTEGRNLDKALLVYKLMTSKEYTTTARPNRQTYNILIRGYAQTKEPTKAETLIRKMQADGFVPDVDLYTATVTSYEKSGQPLQALRLMESMRQDGYDFYDVPVLDGAFKKAVKLVNVVGRGLSTSTSSGSSSRREEELKGNDGIDGSLSFDIDDEGEDETVFIRGRAT